MIDEEQQHVSPALMVRVTPGLVAEVEVPGGYLRPPFGHDIPEPLDPRFVMLADPDSARAESFRLLRDNLLGRDLPRVLAVTSNRRHEGKTTCAVNLALALAERSFGEVLLVDGNLADPELARMFGVDESTPAPPWMNAPWLTPLKIVAVKRGLCVASVVRMAGQPRPCLDPRWFELVIGHLAGGSCEHVIIDTPALESSPAVNRILAAADAVLLALQSGVTTARELRDAVTRIGEHRMIGAVLMDVR